MQHIFAFIGLKCFLPFQQCRCSEINQAKSSTSVVSDTVNYVLLNLPVELLWRTERFLQELLDLVDIGLDFSVEGQERRVCPWSQVVQICWLSAQEKEKAVCHKGVHTLL